MINLENPYVKLILETFESVDASTKVIMIGTVIANLILKASMKKLLQTIKVFQLIAFFYVLNIEFPPLADLVLGKIYEFATFKVIPNELMVKISKALGFEKGSEGQGG
jgi:hypothetical protein